MPPAERNEDCIESSTAAMAMVPQEGCSGLFAGLLKQRGQAYAKRMLLAEALADLQAAQHLQPCDVDCALLQAKVDLFSLIFCWRNMYQNLQKLHVSASGPAI